MQVPDSCHLVVGNSTGKSGEKFGVLGNLNVWKGAQCPHKRID